MVSDEARRKSASFLAEATPGKTPASSNSSSSSSSSSSSVSSSSSSGVIGGVIPSDKARRKSVSFVDVQTPCASPARGLQFDKTPSSSMYIPSVIAPTQLLSLHNTLTTAPGSATVQRETCKSASALVAPMSPTSTMTVDAHDHSHDHSPGSDCSSPGCTEPAHRNKSNYTKKKGVAVPVNIYQNVLLIPPSHNSHLATPVFRNHVSAEAFEHFLQESAQDAALRDSARALRRSQRLQFVHSVTSSNALDLRSFEGGRLGNSSGSSDQAGTPILLAVSKFLRSIGNSTSGVDPFKPAMAAWLAMQVRWVTWTLATWERRNTERYLEVALTAENVQNAVHYRFLIYTRQMAGSVFEGQPCSRSSAARHFATRGAMSPLQRCTDIAQLLWPITVCFSEMDSVDSESSAPKKTFQVSDGWWWTVVTLDAELAELVRSGKLHDGCKAVVFTSIFDASETPTVMRLTWNGFKKANRDAQLGYVSPPKLLIGLSLSSILPQGGPVFAVTVRVARLCQRMTRIRSPYTAVVDMAEEKALRNYIEGKKHSLHESLQGDEEMKMTSILENLGCDQWIIDAMVSLEGGGQVNLTDSQETELHRVHERIGAESRATMERLQRERSAELELDSSSYQDVLVQCCNSGLWAWVRLDTPGGGGDGDFSAPHMETFREGSTVLLTNLKPINSRCAFPLFLYGANSSMRYVTANFDAPSHANGANVKVQSASATATQTAERGIVEYSSTRSLLNSFGEKKSREKNKEVSCTGRVLHWTNSTDTGHGSPGSSSNNTSGSEVKVNGVTSLEVLISDSSRVLVVLKYTVPTVALSSLHWLHIGCKVVVLYGLVEHVDHDMDIVCLARGDRTRVTCGEEVATTLRKQQAITPRQASSAAGRRKSANFSTNSSSAKKDAAAAVEREEELHSTIAFFCEGEKRRYAALSANKTYFCCPESWRMVESCRRRNLRDALVFVPNGNHSTEAGEKYVVVVCTATNSSYIMRVSSSEHYALLSSNRSGESLVCDIVFSRRLITHAAKKEETMPASPAYSSCLALLGIGTVDSEEASIMSPSANESTTAFSPKSKLDGVQYQHGMQVEYMVIDVTKRDVFTTSKEMVQATKAA